MVQWLVNKLINLPGIIIGLSVHEFGHAYCAKLCGDDTSLRQGRVSLDPLAHIDWVGFVTLMCFGFGWGKPVMVNPTKFKRPRLDSILVGLAGVFNNFICAWIFAFILRLMYQFAPQFFVGTGFGSTLSDCVIQTVVINISLMIFNLIPLPPLDGFGVISGIINLPRRFTKVYIWLMKYGQIILILLIVFDGTSYIMSTPLNAIFRFIVNTAFSGL